MDTLAAERIHWAGRQEETEFLGRIWDLAAMPSHDSRFPDAGADIWQHRINNPMDWDDDWIVSDPRFDLLGCEDERFGQFLALTLHPKVREDAAEADRLVRFYNEALASEGWELRSEKALPGLDGARRSIYVAVPRGARPAPIVPERFERIDDPGVLEDHLRRIDEGVERDPAAAIGAAKELVESVCKVILDDYEVEHDRKDDCLSLYKKVAAKLELNAESVPDSRKGSQAAQKALRSLVSTVQSLAELRNELGLGHGRSRRSPAVTRHARLAATAARGVAEFLLETWHERRRVADTQSPASASHATQA